MLFSLGLPNARKRTSVTQWRVLHSPDLMTVIESESQSDPLHGAVMTLKKLVEHYIEYELHGWHSRLSVLTKAT